LPYLLAAGYDRSFEKLSDAPDGPVYQLTVVSLGEILFSMRKIDHYITPGAGLDLGGIAKGWTVDRVSEGLNNCLVLPSMPGAIYLQAGKELTGRFGPSA